MTCARAARVHALLACAILAVGCAARPAAPPTRTWAAPCDTCIGGVVNFAKVSPQLWRGSQPTADGMRNLQRAGARTILSLRSDHDDLPLVDGTTLKYVRIPMHAWDPEEVQLVLLLKVLEKALKDPDSSPVFVHCAQGKDRTGYSIAAYRMVFEGWTPTDAIHEMFDFHFNAVWFENPTFLQRLDVERARALMRLAP